MKFSTHVCWPVLSKCFYTVFLVFMNFVVEIYIDIALLLRWLMMFSMFLSTFEIYIYIYMHEYFCPLFPMCVNLWGLSLCYIFSILLAFGFRVILGYLWTLSSLEKYGRLSVCHLRAHSRACHYNWNSYTF